MRGTPTLVLALVLTVGCYADEVGDYRLHDVFMTSGVCAAGVDPVLAEQWIGAVSQGLVDDLQIARGAGADAATRQAQFRRSSDGSDFWLSVDDEDDGVLTASQDWVGATIGQSGLGSDFSVLLEEDAVGCVFDFSGSLVFEFADDHYGSAEGELLLRVAQTVLATDERCLLTECSVEYRFAAEHISGNPGQLIDGP